MNHILLLIATLAMLLSSIAPVVAHELRIPAAAGRCEFALVAGSKLHKLLDQDDRLAINELKSQKVGLVALNVRFELDNGMFEGLTIEDHALEMLATMRDQLPHLLPHLPAEFVTSVDLVNLLRFGAIVHNLGASAVKDLSSQFGLTAAQKSLVMTLTSQKVMGDFIEGKASMAKTEDKLRTLARLAGLDQGLYFQLQSFFYVVDAASRPTLRKKLFFENPHGALIFRHTRFNELMFAFAR